MPPPVPDIPLLRRPFYFLRHGESAANRDELIAGIVNSPLTRLGREQAVRAADLLAGVEVASVFASTLRRAMDTALPVASRHGLAVTCLSGLGERGWGVLENRPLSERVGGPTAEPVGAEPWPDFVARTWAALALIKGRSPVCIVGHSGTLRALRQGLRISDATKIANAQPVRFDPPSEGREGWTYSAVSIRIG